MFERVTSKSELRVRFLQFPLFSAFPVKKVSLVSVAVAKVGLFEAGGRPMASKGRPKPPLADVPRRPHMEWNISKGLDRNPPTL